MFTCQTKNKVETYHYDGCEDGKGTKLAQDGVQLHSVEPWILLELEFFYS